MGSNFFKSGAAAFIGFGVVMACGPAGGTAAAGAFVAAGLFAVAHAVLVRGTTDHAGSNDQVTADE